MIRKKMNVLGIETATEKLSAAMVIGNISYERHTDSRSSHCELLAGFIMELAKEAGIKMNHINGISVSIGPGSFTGLRIGIATAMGLAYSLGVKAAGVNTLMGLAWKTAKPGTLVCPLIDAKRSQIFAGIYRTGEGIPDTIVSPLAVTCEKLADIVRSQGEQVTITGPAAELFRKTFDEISDSKLTFIPGDKAKPSAVAIAELGRMILLAGKGVNPVALKPVYLRRSDAEILRDKCR